MPLATSLLQGYACLWRAKIYHIHSSLHERASQVLGLFDGLVIRNIAEHGAFYARDSPLRQDEQCSFCG